MADLVAVQACHAEDKTARHKLLTGSLRATVRMNASNNGTPAALATSLPAQR
jgi:hypothetical protein